MEFYYFGEFVFPICELRPDGPNGSRIHRFHGTGFAVGGSGHFLSANHVITAADVAAASAGGGRMAALLKLTTNGTSRSEAAAILGVERCPGKDVAFGKVDRPLPAFFSSKNDDVFGWEDVHVFGYPESLKAHPTAAGQFQFAPKCLKGYVSRRLEAPDLLHSEWAPAYELSFPIPLGVSGSPVFRTGPDHSLVGIALGSVDSTLSVYEETEVISPTEKHSERVRKVEQLGLAARLHELKDWKPDLAGGLRLGELY